jgi:hypothetical protein
MLLPPGSPRRIIVVVVTLSIIYAGAIAVSLTGEEGANKVRIVGSAITVGGLTVALIAWLVSRRKTGR